VNRDELEDVLVEFVPVRYRHQVRAAVDEYARSVKAAAWAQGRSVGIEDANRAAWDYRATPNPYEKEADRDGA